MRDWASILTLAVAAVVALGSTPAVGQIATVELVTGGSDPGLSTIEAPAPSWVPLLLRITNPENLADWQVNLSVSGPAGPIELGSELTWWEGLPNTVKPNSIALDASGTYRVVGMHDFTNVPPWSHSASGTVALASLQVFYQGPEEARVTLFTDDDPFTEPVFSKADPDLGFDFGDLELPVGFSNDTVTIQRGPTTWEFSVDEAPGHDAFGLVTSDPAPDTWPHDTLITVDATPTHPLYVFSHWEATQGTQLPGDPYSSRLEFYLRSDVHLLGHFALIPEPLSLTVLGLGLVGLRLRRRRRA